MYTHFVDNSQYSRKTPSCFSDILLSIRYILKFHFLFVPIYLYLLCTYLYLFIFVLFICTHSRQLLVVTICNTSIPFFYLCKDFEYNLLARYLHLMGRQYYYSGSNLTVSDCLSFSTIRNFVRLRDVPFLQWISNMFIYKVLYIQVNAEL